MLHADAGVLGKMQSINEGRPVQCLWIASQDNFFDSIYKLSIYPWAAFFILESHAILQSANCNASAIIPSNTQGWNADSSARFAVMVFHYSINSARVCSAYGGFVI